MKKNTRLILAAGLALLAVGGFWTLQARKANAPATAAPAVPVVVAQAVGGKMPVVLGVVGRAEAYESVTLKSRLDGQVLSVAYVEGQHVNQGDVLVRLDPADYEARLAQAEANLAKDRALLAKAHADVERYVALKARGFVSDEKVNEVRTADAAAAATLKADQAAFELARLQLSYTTVKAPFAGVVGARLVFPGTAVKTNDTALAVVNRIRPLYVSFAVPEKHLPRLRAAMRSGPLNVRVGLPGSKEAAFEGQARFIDNAVDPASGTIQMKAVLDNRDEKLTAGQFLTVSLDLETLDNAVLVPSETVQQGAEGNFAYVVKADDTVELRKVDVVASYQGRSAIGQGIAAGETVVTDGQLRLTPGTAVQRRTPEALPATAPAKP